MIYAVHILNQKYVKIGFSDHENESKRIAQLQTGNPFEIKTIFTTYGTLMQEQAIHSSLRIAFGRIRIPCPPNEWYPGKGDFFQKFLEYLRYGPDAGLAFCEKYNPAIKQPSPKIPGGVDAVFRWPKND